MIKPKFYMVCFAVAVGFAAQAQITIPAARRVDWNNAGYEGSIPVTYAVTIDVTTFGATGNGVTDDGTAIQNAINNATPGVLTMIYFPTGSYKITAPLTITNNNIVLKGAGPNYSRLVFQQNDGNCITIKGTISATSTAIVSGNTKDSKFLTLAAGNTTFAAGDYIELKSDMNPTAICNIQGAQGNCVTTAAGHSFGQVVKIVSRSGDVIELEDGLSMTHTTGFRAYEMTPRQNVGIQDLQLVKNIVSGDQSDYKVYVEAAANVWISGIESNNTNADHIGIARSTKVEVRGCYIHHASNYGGSAGYSVYVGERSTNCLIEDNILLFHRHAIVLSSSPNRNVIGYNFSGESQYPTPSEFVFHGFYPHANLMEGNIAGGMDIDATWGYNGPYNTMFRNKFDHWSIIGADQNNIVGNTGFYQEGTGPAPTNLLQLHNNYIYSNEPDVSYYYSARPAFITSGYTWPTVGTPPAGMTLSNTNPAEVRYRNGGQFTINPRDPIAQYSIPNTGLLSAFNGTGIAKIYRNQAELSLGTELYYSSTNWETGPLTTVILSSGNEEILSSYNSSTSATVYLSTNKDPNIQTLVFNKANARVTALTTGDFNGDGTDEIVIGYLENNLPRLYKSTDPTNLTQTLLYSNSSAYWKVSALTAGDFDGNGLDELIIGLNSTGVDCKIYKSADATGLGTAIYTHTGGYWNINALAAIDFDENGADELIEGFNCADGAAIYKSPQANATSYNIYPLNNNWRVVSMAVGDMDFDGDKELVTGFNSYGTPTKGVAIYKSETPDVITDLRIYDKVDLGMDLKSLAIQKKRKKVVVGGKSLVTANTNGAAAQPELLAFPNPAEDRLTVMVRNASVTVLPVEIYNSVGAKVLSAVTEDGAATIDLSALQPGLYIVRATVNGDALQSRITVQ